jgi:hypothetical protein
MAALCLAQLVVTFMPFRWWRDHLGGATNDPMPNHGADPLGEARRLAGQVERAAVRLPIGTRCLPRAMALSWILRANRIPHVLVFAVRPAGLRQSADALHAWVEIGGTVVLGELPGPWLETLRLGN